MSELISLIIPVYNVRPYLKRCIESVINQTYKNLEIILVDDGSDDGSQYICDELKKIDKRITVIHQKNQGLSAARNAGIEECKGEWIAFLDSDDWIENEMYETLYRIAVENKADISSCKTRNARLDEPPVCNCNDSGRITVLYSEEIVKGLFDQAVVRFEVWNKLWKRTLIGDVRFKVGQVSEDVYFDRVLFLKANKMVHIDKTLHNYLVYRPGNTLSSFKIARMCVFDEFRELINDLNNMKANETSELIACVGTAFAISMYGEAKRSKQSGTILKQLKNEFNLFYGLSQKCVYRSKKGKIAAFLFDKFPGFTCRLLDLKVNN